MRAGPRRRPPTSPPVVTLFQIEEGGIADLQEAIAAGQLTSASVTQQYLDRIAAIDHSGPSVNSVIELNPEALAVAARLDDERKAGKSRGPLHGVPILIKDNIDTGDRMRTSAGSLALADMPAPADAFVVQRLRAAGAIILGKTNCSEWANFRSSHSTSGWSGRGGQTRNPVCARPQSVRIELRDRGRHQRQPGDASASALRRTARWCAPAMPTASSGSSPPSAS